MAKKKDQQPEDESAGGRSPAWQVFARIDPELRAACEAYIASQEYPPTMSRVLERALRDLLKRAGFWPPKS